MTEKNIFVYKLFFVVEYFRFQFIFYVKTATPLKNFHPLLKLISCQAPLFENLVGGSIPPPQAERRVGTHYAQDYCILPLTQKAYQFNSVSAETRLDLTRGKDFEQSSLVFQYCAGDRELIYDVLPPCYLFKSFLGCRILVLDFHSLSKVILLA